MDYTEQYSESSLQALLGVWLGFMILFSLAISVITIAGMWKTFTKAGKPGWAALIPIYNVYVMIQIVGKPDIWLLWCLIPCVNIVFTIWLQNLLSKSFGKEEGFTLGLILFPFIFYPILGFGSAKYLGPSAEEARNRGFGNPFGNPNDPFNQQQPPHQF
ncbi:DUF5684 domain-containing protein [Pedobacter montanisoli]|uniref:DUF5684 domain-containing protein n=1 Tax=Pedobacter montanisoli TaxID=2923277 RepID=A0ABS9ZSR3_9SPHI|nr:DUF5684 domain-containing protein [Pedobacter montanisoli]MCJ0741358.1 DUF5684 domain-containing protein [Pedobacter montanisoli]